MDDFEQECINDFIEETDENLDVIDQSFLELEKDPKNQMVIDNVFRAIHTIKGGCRLINFKNLENISHSAENMLDMVRSGSLDLETNHISLLLKTNDIFRYFLSFLKENNSEAPEQCQLVIDQINAACEGQSFMSDELSVEKILGKSVAVEEEKQETEKVVEETESSVEVAEESPQEEPKQESNVNIDVQPVAEEPEPDVQGAEIVEEVNEASPKDESTNQVAEAETNIEPQVETIEAESKEESNNEDTGIQVAYDAETEKGQSVDTAVPEEKKELEALEEEWGMKEESVPTKTEKQEQATSLTTTKKALPKMSDADIEKVEQISKVTKVEASETIRIDIKRLDTLMNLVGKLVLSRNQLKQVSLGIEDSDLISTTNSISLITSELQEEIMNSRLQPISLLLSKFQRTVRDMAHGLGKEVKLTITGGNTELDRTLLETIKDPLTHLLRNSVDHGIEMPEEREEKGKSRQGDVIISCSHESGFVVIDIIDDGGGLDAKKLGAKAIQKGLVTEDELEKMSKKEIFSFIFQPGFSTAEQVTNISGRGVGMDVVKTNITSIGGQIELDSTPGEGATIHIQIPLTLAIIPALIIASKEQKFAVPQANLKELILIEEKDRHKIEKFEDVEVYRLRGNLLPLLRLRTVLGFSEDESSNKFYIVVLMSGEQQYGLIVDYVDDTEEIVVKPLAKFFQNVLIYSGASIMGDGSISLILDIEALGKMSNIETSKKKLISSTTTRAKVSSTALTFSLGGEEVFGVQMSQISRLEEIKISDIELSGNQEVIQYRGDLLPIIRLSNQMDIDENYDQDSANLIVFYVNGREAGLLVREIIDSVGLEGELDNTVVEHPFILGTMVLRNEVVLLLDVIKVFKMSFLNWANQEQIQNVGPKKILYVDDSPFYLKVVKRYLKDGGYDVDTCQNSVESLGIIKSGNYDLFIFDYEMPDMDGKELTEKVRSMPQYNFTPIIILTALTGGDEKKSIINSGIQNYLVKLDKEELLDEVGKMLSLELVEV